MLFLKTEYSRFTIKAGLAGGAVYYLADQGVWKESTESIKICDRMNIKMKPYVDDIKKQIPFEVSLINACSINV